MTRKLILLLSVGILTACNQSNPNICSVPLPIMAMKDAPPDIRAESCIHRWAYRLSDNTEPLPDVVAAVIGGCKDAIESAAAEQIAEQGVGAQNMDLRTSKLKPVAQLVYEDLESKARFYVLQARQGRCRIQE